MQHSACFGRARQPCRAAQQQTLAAAYAALVDFVMQHAAAHKAHKPELPPCDVGANTCFSYPQLHCCTEAATLRSCQDNKHTLHTRHLSHNQAAAPHLSRARRSPRCHCRAQCSCRPAAMQAQHAARSTQHELPAQYAGRWQQHLE